MTPTAAPYQRDLVVLVADKNMEAVLSGLLDRPHALGIRPVSFDIFVHPHRDPGCRSESAAFLRPFTESHFHALVLFDHEGSGREDVPAEFLGDDVQSDLQDGGWAGRAEVVVLAPELEIWAWTQSPHLARCLGWEGRSPALLPWLEQVGFWLPGDAKPRRPKEAFEAALRDAHKPRSSARVYGELARSVSLQGHQEPAFVRLTLALRAWFGP